MSLKLPVCVALNPEKGVNPGLDDFMVCRVPLQSWGNVRLWYYFTVRLHLCFAAPPREALTSGGLCRIERDRSGVVARAYGHIWFRVHPSAAAARSEPALSARHIVRRSGLRCNCCEDVCRCACVGACCVPDEVVRWGSYSRCAKTDGWTERCNLMRVARWIYVYNGTQSCPSVSDQLMFCGCSPKNEDMSDGIKQSCTYFPVLRL